MVVQIGIQAIFAAVSVYIARLYFTGLFEKKNKAKIIDVGASIILFVVMLRIEGMHSGTETVLLTIAVYFLYEFLLFQGTLFKKIFYGLLYVLLNLSGILVRGYLSNVNLYQGNWQLGWDIEIDTVFVKVLLLFATIFVIHFDKKKQMNFGQKKQISYDKRVFQMFLVFPVTTCVLLLAIFQSDLYEYGMQRNPGILLIAIIFLILSNVVVQYMFEEYTVMQQREKEKDLERMQKQMEVGYYKKVEENNEEYRKFMHDVKQYFSVINAMAKNNNNENMLRFLQDIHYYMEGISNVVYSSNTMLNAILLEKKLLAANNNISFHVRIEQNVKLNGIDDVDLIGVVGNILDNAIEAADKIEKKEERKITVEGYMSEAHHFFVFSVKNTIHEIPQKNKGTFRTWKKDSDKHGIGLKNIEEILQKYNGYMNIEIKGYTFCNSVFFSVK